MSEEKSARELVDELRANLQAAGARRGYGEQIEQGAMHDIAKLVRRADGILSVAEMHRLSGVSRDTIYTILKEGK